MNSNTVKKLTERLDAATMSSKVLLSTFTMLDESSRQSPSYNDSRYAPFYYLLGQELPVANLLEIGFGIGIASGSYVRGCESVEHILAFQESGKSYYSPRIGIHNVRRGHYKGSLQVHLGKILDIDFAKKLAEQQWELVIVNEDKDYDSLMSYLDIVWDHLADEGTVLMEYVMHSDAAGAAYKAFCRSKGQTEQVLPTRYGIGVLTR